MRSLTSGYRICTFCVMDTSDPDIEFDESGRCNHCRRHGALLQRDWKRGNVGREALDQVCDEIRSSGRGKSFDCIVGLSGGVDSTYVLLKTKEIGLRPLAVHVDNGWNAPEAVRNIKRAVESLGVELHTEVLNWGEFRRLQLAFLRASTPDSEIPTDHAIGAVLFKVAAREGVRHIVSGHNIQTEGLSAPAWSRGYHDWKYIRSVNRLFGGVPLATFPHYSVLGHVWYRNVLGIRRVEILNLIPYERDSAKQELIGKLNWEDYGGKHYESVYTRYYQGVILPRKFGYDKRRAHLSTQISAGVISRESAIRALELPPCSPEQEARDRAFVVKKLGISDAEFEQILAAPGKTITDYPSYEGSLWYRAGRELYKRLAGTADPGY